QPQRQNFVSPFAADSARKGNPRQESSSEAAPPTGPRIVAAASAPEPVIMGSAAPAPLPDRREVASHVSSDATRQPKPELQAAPPQPATAPPPLEHLQNAVLQALTDGNQRILVSMLSAGEWSVQGNELIIKIGESQTVL